MKLALSAFFFLLIVMGCANTNSTTEAIVAESSFPPETFPVVVRLLKDGQIDQNWNGGEIPAAMVNRPEILKCPAQVGDGLVFDGNAVISSGASFDEFIMLQHDVVGDLNKSFPNNSHSIKPFHLGYGRYSGGLVKRYDSQRLLVIGSARSRKHSAILLGRLIGNGAFDPTFADAGSIVLTPQMFGISNVSSWTVHNAFVLQNGAMRILAVGDASIFLLGVKASGDVDRSFGQNGQVKLRQMASSNGLREEIIDSSIIEPQSALILGINQPTAAGGSQDGGFELGKFDLETGAPDPNFGSAGTFTATYSTGPSRLLSLTTLPNSIAVLSGFRINAGSPFSNYGIYEVSFDGNETDFAGNSRTVFSAAPLSGLQLRESIAATDGHLIVAGSNPRFTNGVAKIIMDSPDQTLEGALDRSFANNGVRLMSKMRDQNLAVFDGVYMEFLSGFETQAHLVLLGRGRKSFGALCPQ
ncbi:MAG: hypothetical protein AAFO74_02275 [Pseudomonadota bacterium]